MKKYILFFSTLVAMMLLAVSCQEIDEFENYLPTTIETTSDVTVDYYTATIKSYASRRYIVISENADLSNPIKTESIHYSGIVDLYNLKANTTYYYQEYYEDRKGYRVNGDIKTFTTKPFPTRIEAVCERATPTSSLTITLYIYDFTGSSTDIGCHLKRTEPQVPYMQYITHYDLGWHFNTTQYNWNSDNPWVMQMSIPYSSWSYNSFYYQPYIRGEEVTSYGEIKQF